MGIITLMLCDTFKGNFQVQAFSCYNCGNGDTDTCDGPTDLGNVRRCQNAGEENQFCLKVETIDGKHIVKRKCGNKDKIQNSNNHNNNNNNNNNVNYNNNINVRNNNNNGNRQIINRVIGQGKNSCENTMIDLYNNGNMFRVRVCTCITDNCNHGPKREARIYLIAMCLSCLIMLK